MCRGQYHYNVRYSYCPLVPFDLRWKVVISRYYLRKNQIISDKRSFDRWASHCLATGHKESIDWYSFLGNKPCSCNRGTINTHPQHIILICMGCNYNLYISDIKFHAIVYCTDEAKPYDKLRYPVLYDWCVCGVFNSFGMWSAIATTYMHLCIYAWASHSSYLYYIRFNMLHIRIYFLWSWQEHLLSCYHWNYI